MSLSNLMETRKSANMGPLNGEKVKGDFPIFNRVFNGNPLVYLDSAATTQKPNVLMESLTNFYSTHNANVHRGVYALAEEATQLYEQSRTRIAKFLNWPFPENIIFTRNTTESINLIAHSWARHNLKEGDVILLTELEHHSNFVPWYLLAQEKGIKIKVAPITPTGELNLDEFKTMLTPEVKLVAITAMSNVLGTIVPLKTIIEWAHANGSRVAVDGAQWTPHLQTDLTDLNCDFWSFSAHKMLGPTGVGVLWVKPEILDTMEPFLGGGEMISTVSVEKTTWADAPYKFEAGTSNIADIAAFADVLDYLNQYDWDRIRSHEKRLTDYALEKLQTLPDLTIFGPTDSEKTGGVISFNHNVVHAHDVGTILSEAGVAIRVGHHCAQPLMKVLGVPATARASFYIYNTEKDVDALIEGLQQVNKVFGLDK